MTPDIMSSMIKS